MTDSLCASASIRPEPIRPRADEMTVETYPIPGIHQKGGQQCGVPSGVRITHSSGVTAYVDIGRSQHINKMIAEDMILAAITHPRFRP